jgi:hypothetical protein
MALKNGDPEGHVLMKTHLDMLAANGIGWVTPWLRT